MNTLFAFDFDGVICDSAIETAHSGWKTARQIWADMPVILPEPLLQQFRQVRPALETGYEAALILRLLFEGVAVSEMLVQFHAQLNALIARDKLVIDKIKPLFGQTRDQWLAQDFSHWIAMNPLFPAVADKLRQLDANHCVIITTKQERFVDHILKANDIAFPLDNIYGLDRNLSKQQVLSDLSAQQHWQSIVFIEDRLPTLLNVMGDDRLDHIALYLADWGYNTVADREHAHAIARIQQLSLTNIPSL